MNVEMFKKQRMTPEQQTAVEELKKAVRLLVRREICASWKGNAHPEDMESIDADLRSAKAAYAQRVHVVERLFNQHLDP